MRRMFSLKQLIALIKEHAVSGLLGKDINVEGITSKGIANTGALANIGDVAVTGDVSASGDLTAKTLEQSQANAVVEFNAPSVEGFTKLSEYCRFIKVNQTLKIILCARYQNNDTTGSQNFSLGGTVVNIPESLGVNIFDMNGDNLTATPSTAKGANIIRLASILLNVYGISTYSHQCQITHYAQNQIRIFDSASQAVGASNVITFSMECNLSLI